MQKVEEREAITLTNNGQKLFGILHRPLNQTRYPAIVICPGFAGTKCGKYRLFVRLGKALAKMGIAVLRFDYRGSGDSEGEFEEITINGKVSDTLKALDFLSQDPHVDANHVGLLGRSLGGMISILAARQSQHVKSLVLWAPVFTSDPWHKLWKMFQSQKEHSIQKELPLRLPFHIPNLQFLKEFFNIKMQDELAGLNNLPLLHIHGEQDTVVSIDHAEGYKQVRQIESLTRFVRLPKSDHDFSDFDEQKIILMETCQWYQQTLQR
jgi:alpha/beta superfamily hydrolase